MNRASVICWLSRLNRGLGLAPGAWLFSTAVVVGRGALYLGHLPRYHDPVPPGWEGASAWFFLSLIAAGYATYAWGALTVVLLVVAPHELRSNKVSIALCLLGMGAIVAIGSLTRVFEWPAD